MTSIPCGQASVRMSSDSGAALPVVENLDPIHPDTRVDQGGKGSPTSTIGDARIADQERPG